MIELKKVSKSFEGADGAVAALEDVSLTIADGDIFGIIGMSGAGKSTLVRCINMLGRPTSGQVLIDGVDIGALTAPELRLARRKVTMIFQNYNLLMQRTCLRNICFPLELAGVKKEKAEARARELLETVGLPDKANAYPAQLSGGQQQRIAIARALATEPKVLLCDEATSALDPKTTRSILDLIREINAKLGVTVIIITHSMSVVEEVCRNVAILEKGRVVETGPVSEIFAHPKSEAARKLVFPAGENASAGTETLPNHAGERVIRVVFSGALAAASPMITQMAIDERIAANILGANTKCVGEQVYGNMLLGLPDDDAVVRRAITYLTQTPDVHAEEVHVDA